MELLKSVKAFRNEIVARQFIFRMREFEQMEMQFFVRPGEEMKWYEYWKELRMKWHQSLGMGEDNYRFHDHETLAHYKCYLILNLNFLSDLKSWKEFTPELILI